MAKKRKKQMGIVVLDAYERRMQRCLRIYDLSQKIWVVLVITAFFYDWRYGLGVLLFGLWSFFWYERGCMLNVVDEYEHAYGGYPDDGVRLLIKSYFALAIVFVVLGALCLH